MMKVMLHILIEGSDNPVKASWLIFANGAGAANFVKSKAPQ